jgi:hypothetical protein
MRRPNLRCCAVLTAKWAVGALAFSEFGAHLQGRGRLLRDHPVKVPVPSALLCEGQLL